MCKAAGLCSKCFPDKDKEPDKHLIKSNVIKIKTDRYHDDASSWKSNRLIFRNASLKEVLTTLSRHFDIEITVKNEKIASFTYDFVCKGNDLNYVLEVMQSITPVSFKKISEYTYTVE